MAQYKEVVRQICKVVLEQRFSFAAISNDIGGVHSLNPPPHALATYPTPKLLVSDTCQHLLCCGIDLYTVKKMQKETNEYGKQKFFSSPNPSCRSSCSFRPFEEKKSIKNINLKIR